MEIDMTFRKALDVADLVEVTLETAEIEETNENDDAYMAGIHAYLNWFYDGEQSEFDK